MLAVLLVLALLGAAHCDPEPEPEPKSFTKMIHMPAPKVQHVHKPALQEHAVPVVQHIPFQQTVVRTVNVPKDIVREVPVYVFQDMVLRSPVLKPKVIDVQKTLIKPHIKDVPVEHVRYVKRPYNVVHTRYVKQPFPQYRKVIIPKVKVVHKTLNRVIEVPKLHIRDKVKHVIKPYPVIRKRIVKKPVDVPIHVDVPTPVVTNRHVTHTRKVPVQVNVVRKVHVPKKVVLKELVPIPVKDPRRRVGRIVTVRYGYDMAPVSRVYTSRVGYVSGGLVRGPGGVVISGPGGVDMGGPGAVDMEGPIPGLGGPLDAGFEGAGAALGGSVSGAFSSGFGDFEGGLAAARGGGSSFGFQDPLTGGDSGMGVSLPDGRSSDFNEMSDIDSSIGMRRKPGHYSGGGF